MKIKRKSTKILLGVVSLTMIAFGTMEMPGDSPVTSPTCWMYYSFFNQVTMSDRTSSDMVSSRV